MVIQRTTVGDTRIELQNHPIILPTTTFAVLNTGDRQKISNDTLDFAVITWDGDDLIKITPAAAYQGAFAQYQVRVKQELNIDVSDKAIIGA